EDGGAGRMVGVVDDRGRGCVCGPARAGGLAVAARAALAVAAGDEGHRLRANLQAHVARLRDALAARGLLAPGAGRTPIFPLLIGDERRYRWSGIGALPAARSAHSPSPPAVAPAAPPPPPLVSPRP